MGKAPKDYQEAYERVLARYLKESQIKRGVTKEARSAAFLSQISKLEKIGLILNMKDQYRHANYAYKLLTGESLSKQVWEKRDLAYFLRKSQAAARTRKRGKRSPYTREQGVVRAFEKWRDRKVRDVPRDAKGRFAGRIE